MKCCRMFLPNQCCYRLIFEHHPSGPHLKPLQSIISLWSTQLPQGHVGWQVINQDFLRLLLIRSRQEEKALKPDHRSIPSKPQNTDHKHCYSTHTQLSSHRRSRARKRHNCHFTSISMIIGIVLINRAFQNAMKAVTTNKWLIWSTLIILSRSCLQ